MLILAAFPPELAPFSDSYRNGALTVGIGLVAAAHATASLVAALHPTSVLLVGSCGVYPAPRDQRTARPRPAIGSVVVAENVVLVDSAAVRGDAALPEPMNARAEVDRSTIARFAEQGCVPAIVASTLGITTSDSLAHALAERSGADVENLEAFAVAEACAAAGIPCTVVLGITNVVGSEGRGQWRQNHVEVAMRVAHVVERVLGRAP